MATPTPFEQFQEQLTLVQEQLVQVQAQVTEVYEALRVHIDEAVEQTREGAQMATELAVKLAYAGVGAAVVAQEQISHRVAELVNSR